jgi:hypothetical protein
VPELGRAQRALSRARDCLDPRKSAAPVRADVGEQLPALVRQLDDVLTTLGRLIELQVFGKAGS